MFDPVEITLIFISKIRPTVFHLLGFILQQINVLLVHEDFQDFKPRDAYDSGNESQAEIDGMHGGEMENLLQEGHKNDKAQKHERSAQNPSKRRVG